MYLDVVATSFLVMRLAVLYPMRVLVGHPWHQDRPNSLERDRRLSFQSATGSVDGDTDGFERCYTQQHFSVIGTKDDSARSNLAHESNFHETKFVLLQAPVSQFVWPRSSNSSNPVFASHTCPTWTRAWDPSPDSLAVTTKALLG